ncbi:tetratricopeptide repeat protein [Brucepastera parasyntrophica]|uniref:tetratricopeptide repeat protein n=1 Tax=Brucepastera parasyntrophica TaxID=2880008 RepID=UPI00210D3549|nr:tetratricopeptide repeat protein [Brucepastera parasyntrophica]ULQ60141.1 tetratricopeptide repeat protein [Brucepastera parasyntrophica]
MSPIVIAFILIFGTVVVVLFIFLLKSVIAPKRIEGIVRLIKAEKYSQAIKLAKTILAKNPRDAEARYMLGKAYLADGKDELALMEFKTVNATAVFSKTIPEKEFRKTIAQLFLKFNQPDEALKEYLLLVKLEPFQAEHYYNAGVLFEQRNNGDQAMAYYKKAVETNPKHADAHAALGLLLFKHNQFNEARQEITTALKLDPKNTRAYFYQGKILRKIHDYANALTSFEKALRDPELKQKALIERGCCYMEANNLEKAIVEFERALSSSQSNSSNETLHARYFLAACYEKTRDIDKALTQWEEINKARRNFRDVGEKLNQYQELRSNDHMKEYLTAGKDDFFAICEALANQALELSMQEIHETKYGCFMIAVEDDPEKWRNVKKMPRLIHFFRDPEPIEDSFIRMVQEDMKRRNIIRGIIITSSGFSRGAHQYAENRPIELIGKEKLEQMLASTNIFAKK